MSDDFKARLQKMQGIGMMGGMSPGGRPPWMKKKDPVETAEIAEPAANAEPEVDEWGEPVVKKKGPPPRPTTTASTDFGPKVRPPCKTCKCDDFTVNVFKKNHCNTCFHDHPKMVSASALPATPAATEEPAVEEEEEEEEVDTAAEPCDDFKAPAKGTVWSGSKCRICNHPKRKHAAEESQNSMASVFARSAKPSPFGRATDFSTPSVKVRGPPPLGGGSIKSLKSSLVIPMGPRPTDKDKQIEEEKRNSPKKITHIRRVGPIRKKGRGRKKPPSHGSMQFDAKQVALTTNMSAAVHMDKPAPTPVISEEPATTGAKETQENAAVTATAGGKPPPPPKRKTAKTPAAAAAPARTDTLDPFSQNGDGASSEVIYVGELYKYKQGGKGGHDKWFAIHSGGKISWGDSGLVEEHGREAVAKVLLTEEAEMLSRLNYTLDSEVDTTLLLYIETDGKELLVRAKDVADRELWIEQLGRLNLGSVALEEGVLFRGYLNKFKNNSASNHAKFFTLFATGEIGWGDTEQKQKYKETVERVYLAAADVYPKIPVASTKGTENKQHLLLWLETSGKPLLLLANSQAVKDRWQLAFEQGQMKPEGGTLYYIPPKAKVKTGQADSKWQTGADASGMLKGMMIALKGFPSEKMRQRYFVMQSDALLVYKDPESLHDVLLSIPLNFNASVELVADDSKHDREGKKFEIFSGGSLYVVMAPPTQPELPATWVEALATTISTFSPALGFNMLTIKQLTGDEPIIEGVLSKFKKGGKNVHDKYFQFFMGGKIRWGDSKTKQKHSEVVKSLYITKPDIELKCKDSKSVNEDKYDKSLMMFCETTGKELLLSCKNYNMFKTWKCAFAAGNRNYDNTTAFYIPTGPRLSLDERWKAKSDGSGALQGTMIALKGFPDGKMRQRFFQITKGGSIMMYKDMHTQQKVMLEIPLTTASTVTSVPKQKHNKAGCFELEIGREAPYVIMAPPNAPELCITWVKAIQETIRTAPKTRAKPAGPPPRPVAKKPPPLPVQAKRPGPPPRPAVAKKKVPPPAPKKTPGPPPRPTAQVAEPEVSLPPPPVEPSLEEEGANEEVPAVPEPVATVVNLPPPPVPEAEPEPVEEEEEEASEEEEVEEESKEIVAVVCSECEEGMSTIWCAECEEQYCDDCSGQMHRMKKFKKHVLLAVRTQEQIDAAAEAKRQAKLVQKAAKKAAVEKAAAEKLAAEQTRIEAAAKQAAEEERLAAATAAAAAKQAEEEAAVKQAAEEERLAAEQAQAAAAAAAKQAEEEAAVKQAAEEERLAAEQAQAAAAAAAKQAEEEAAATQAAEEEAKVAAEKAAEAEAEAAAEAEAKVATASVPPPVAVAPVTNTEGPLMEDGLLVITSLENTDMKWFRMQDEEGDFYFENPWTGETAWDEPSEPYGIYRPAEEDIEDTDTAEAESEQVAKAAEAKAAADAQAQEAAEAAEAQAVADKQAAAEQAATEALAAAAAKQAAEDAQAAAAEAEAAEEAKQLAEDAEEEETAIPGRPPAHTRHVTMAIMAHDLPPPPVPMEMEEDELSSNEEEVAAAPPQVLDRIVSTFPQAIVAEDSEDDEEEEVSSVPLPAPPVQAEVEEPQEDEAEDTFDAPAPAPIASASSLKGVISSRSSVMVGGQLKSAPPPPARGQSGSSKLTFASPPPPRNGQSHSMSDIPSPVKKTVAASRQTLTPTVSKALTEAKAASEHVSNEPKIVEGYLEKRGGPLKRWSSRYFALKEGKLSYYKDAAEFYKNSNKVVGSIELKGNLSCQPVKTSKYSKEFVFELSIPGKKVYILRAQNDKRRKHWVQGILKSTNF